MGQKIFKTEGKSVEETTSKTIKRATTVVNKMNCQNNEMCTLIDFSLLVDNKSVALVFNKKSEKYLNSRLVGCFGLDVKDIATFDLNFAEQFCTNTFEYVIYFLDIKDVPLITSTVSETRKGIKATKGKYLIVLAGLNLKEEQLRPFKENFDGIEIYRPISLTMKTV